MKRWVQLIVVFFSMLLGLGISQAAPLDRIVAVVNDSVVTQSQLDQQMQIAHQPRDLALQHLIDMQLQLQMANKMGIKINDADLGQAIEQIAQRNGISREQLQRELQKQGTSFSTFQQEIRNQMIVSQLQQKAVASTVVISQQEINDAMGAVHQQPVEKKQLEYHVLGILVPFSDNPTEPEIAAAKKCAQKLVTKLKAGANLQHVTIEGSDKQPELQRGDLGWHKLSGFPDLFVPYLQRLKSGDVSEPIQAPNGFHVLKVAAVRGGDVAGTPKNGEPISLRSQAQQLVFQKKFQEAVQKWLEQLRKQAYIKIESK